VKCFPERGFKGDMTYPAKFGDGNSTAISDACGRKGKDAMIVCPLNAPYKRETPTKQTILCMGVSALETIMADKVMKKVENNINYGNKRT